MSIKEEYTYRVLCDALLKGCVVSTFPNSVNKKEAWKLAAATGWTVDENGRCHTCPSCQKLSQK